MIWFKKAENLNIIQVYEARPDWKKCEDNELLQ